MKQVTVVEEVNSVCYRSTTFEVPDDYDQAQIVAMFRKGEMEIMDRNYETLDINSEIVSIQDNKEHEIS